MVHPVCVYLGEELAAYNFGADHPFGPQRHAAFAAEFQQQGLDQQVDVLAPVAGDIDQLLSFHTPQYVAKVKALSQWGQGVLDGGDTLAFAGMFEISLHVVGTTLDAVRRVMAGEHRRAFTPIAGLHHARRDTAAGFCIFNDCGIAIEQLRRHYRLERVAYVDIDAHHGDGVFYSFEDDPTVCFVDLHEDGRFLYPGTGAADESGRGVAKGSKLNIPMPRYADDTQFLQAWEPVEDFIRTARPQFILLQCGADSIKGDPITHLHYSPLAHAHAAARLCCLADELCDGRLVAMGGGGYKLANLAQAWCAVVRSMIQHTPATAVASRT